MIPLPFFPLSTAKCWVKLCKSQWQPAGICGHSCEIHLHNQTIRTTFPFLSQWLQGRHSTVYQTSAPDFWSYWPLIPGSAGLSPGLPEPWTPRVTASAGDHGLAWWPVGLGNAPSFGVIWLCREIGHPWSIKGPLNECRSIISGPIATTNNCQLGSISVSPSKSLFYCQFNQF